jgi:hypothetical protein
MLALVALVAGVVLWLLYSGPAKPPATPTPDSAPVASSPASPPPPPPTPMQTSADCGAPSRFAAAAAANGSSVRLLAWSPWGREELGWETYTPLIGREIGSACPAATPGFADALARWQAARGLVATGVMAAPTFEAMRVTWLRRRPFAQAMAQGCPAPADPATLEPARREEGYSGKPVSLRPAALSAYRRMVAAARAEVPAVAADKRLLTIFSGFRAPTVEDDRCYLDRTCGNLTRASCSAHRTGLAFDLYVGEAPGQRPESSDDLNRLHQSRNPAYRWLAANASRFGFVPYPFEPWHWEWTGEAP